MSKCAICFGEGFHHHIDCPNYEGCTGHTGECGCICKWCGKIGGQQSPDCPCDEGMTNAGYRTDDRRVHDRPAPKVL